jgi:hypothetical protein
MIKHKTAQVLPKSWKKSVPKRKYYEQENYGKKTIYYKQLESTIANSQWNVQKNVSVKLLEQVT